MDDAAADLLAFMRAVAALHGALLAVGETVAGAGGLSRAHHRCLQQIADGPLTVAEIAARLGLARQGVLRVADLLVSDGLASYADNPRHRTAKLLTLGDTGRQALDEVARAHEHWVADTADELVPLDLHGLTDRLLVVQAAVGPRSDRRSPTKATP